MQFLWVKSLHIIFVVSWFAGLFYLVRLYIYFIEATERPEAEKTLLQTQLLVMAKRLWLYITTPAMWLSITFGSWLLFLVPQYLLQSWMYIKLFGVTLVLAYHYHLGFMLKQATAGKLKWTSRQLRAYNEVATLLLFICVFAIVLKNTAATFKGLGIAFLVIGLLFIIITYKRKLAAKKGNH